MADIQQLIFDIIARDKASEGLSKAGASAREAAGNVDTLSRRLEEVGRKSATARVGLAGDKDAQASLDRIDAKLLGLDRKTASPRLTVEGAARAIAEISAVDLELDKIGQKGGSADVANQGLSALTMPGGGMGALIGAGVVLSPILTTLAFGLGSFGLAAAGVAAPIEKAAGKTGGLSKNMKDLDPEQRAVARGLLALQGQFGDFEKALQPQVLGVFNDGLHLAAGLLHDVQPVAAATGSAIDGLLGRIDAEFQSQTWQSFFGFMAREAGPDIQLLGNNLIDLMNTLPPLLRDLQPLAKGFLQASDGALKLAGTVVHLSDQERALAEHAKDSGGWIGRLAKAAQDAFQRMYPGTKVIGIWNQSADHFSHTSAPAAAKGFVAISSEALTAGTSVATLNADLEHLNALLSNQSAQVSWKQAQLAATKAVQEGSKALDGNSAKQLENRQKVIASTQAALQYAQQEEKTKGGIRDAIATLADQIRFLERTHDKSAWLRAELRLLRKAEDDLRSRHLSISVDAAGNWYVKGAGVGHGQQPGRPPGQGMAAGGRLAGYGGGDRHPALLESGETVVSKESSRLPFMRAAFQAAGVPGYAAGGVAGSYHGALPGLGPWMQREDTATLNAVAAATAAAFLAAKPVGGHVGWHPGGGVAQWAPEVLSALKQVGVPQSYELLVLYQMMTESGGNPNIVNKWDSNWAAGHPSVGLMQVIAGTFDAYAGPYRNTGPFLYGVSIDPMANIFAALNYGAHNGRGFGTGPGQIGSGHGYDSGGYLPMGWSLAYNGTGKPEPVGPAAGTTVININVTVGPTAHKREVGRAIAEALAEFKKAGGFIYKPGGF